MSWHYLQESDEASWEENSLGGIPDVLLRLIPTADLFCLPDNEMDISQDSRFGMISKPSMGFGGADLLTCSPAGSLVNLLASPENEITKPVQKISGPIQQELFRKSEAHSSCSKMCRGLENTCPWLSETCEELATPSKGPPLLPPPVWVQDILGVEFGYLPTCTASSYGTSNNGSPRDGREEYKQKGKPSLRKYLGTATVKGQYNKKGASKKSGDGLCSQLGGPANPEWLEWYMGFPIGWTAKEPLAMHKFRLWLQQHGVF